MRFIFLIYGLLFFVAPILFAQKAENPTSVLPSKKIFEEFQKDTNFLNAKTREIDLLTHQLPVVFNTVKLDSVNLAKHCLALHNSLQEFTNFNVQHLIKIDKQLNGNQPIRGSEMTYLNKSFQLYKQYATLLKSVHKKSKIIDNKKHHNSQILKALQSNITQLSSFYKNYYTVIGNTKLRRVLNSSDLTYDIKDNDFKNLSLQNLKRKNYQTIKKNIDELTYSPTNCTLVDTSIYIQIKDKKYKDSRIRQDKKLIQSYFWQDTSYKIGQLFTHYISGAIGNFAGLFRFRKGYLYRNDSIKNRIINHLKPMDLIAEKTGFALTDKMIPGHFGHIAIWLGTEAQLKNLQLWNHPVIRPIQPRIRAGYSILETDRGGTHLKTLQDFMNIDALAVAQIIGFDELPIQDKVSLYQNALAQIGKEYDFNFDVETSDKLVCSELLYQVFGSIHWPTNRLLKRVTISPDNVLSLALYQKTPIQLSYYVSAENRQQIYLKSLHDLATDLGFKEKNDLYVLPEKKCVKNKSKNRKKQKQECEIIFHDLIYE